MADSAAIRTALTAAENEEERYPAKSFAVYMQAVVASRRIRNKALLLSSLNDVGLACMEMNKLDTVLIVLNQALNVARELNDTLRIGLVLCNIGNNYMHLKNNERAIRNYLDAATIWEHSGKRYQRAILYANITSLLTAQHEYARAIEFGNKAITQAHETGDTLGEMNGLLNLAELYNDLNDWKTEKELLVRSLPLAEKSGLLDQLSTLYFDLGNVYFHEENLQESLRRFQLSYQIAETMGNRYHVSKCAAALALAYHRLKRESEAKKYILFAEAAGKEVGARADMKEIFLTRAEIESASGNDKIANEYLSQALTLSDSLFQSSTSEKVAEMEAKYQNENKQREILQLGKEKQLQALSIRQKTFLNSSLLIAVAVLVITGLLVVLNIRNRHLLAKKEVQLQQQRISELEKDKQLEAVDWMLKGQEEERSRLAKDLHDGLGGLLSGVKFSLSNMKSNLVITADNMAVFERSVAMIDTSIRELRRVAHNMMPEMLTKFGVDEALKEYCARLNAAKLLEVRYQSIGMQLPLEKSVEIIVYRIVQELLNNVLKHAGASEVMVQLVRDPARLNIVVEDNGKGFNVEEEQVAKGAGLTSIRSRVDYLRGRLDIHAAPGAGTLVNIEFNF